MGKRFPPSQFFTLGCAAQTTGAQPPVSQLCLRDARRFAPACTNVTGKSAEASKSLVN